MHKRIFVFIFGILLISLASTTFNAQLSGQDIILSLENSLIKSSYELTAVVTFESFGTVPTPINLTFIILDEFGNEYAIDKDFIVVTTEEVLRKKFEVLYLPDGKYTLVLQTLYNVDVSYESRQEFEIRKGRIGITGMAIDFVKGEGKWWISGVIMIISLGILVFVINSLLRRK